MTLTKTQIFHRTDDLSGEIKAAREAQSECRNALADQERLTDIARQAVERADARVAALEAERADLAEQARLAILGVGEPPPLAENGPEDRVECEVVEPEAGLALYGEQGVVPRVQVFNAIFTECADVQAQALENGLSRISDAFDRATR